MLMIFIRAINCDLGTQATSPKAGQPATNEKGGFETRPCKYSRNPARPYDRRATISFLISAIALAGLRCLGQVFEQFMIVWQR